MGIQKLRFDWLLFVLVSLLMIFSILPVYSSSSFYAEYKFGEYDIFFSNHLRNVIASFLLMIFFAFFNYRKFLKITNLLLYISIILLVIVLLISSPVKGAARWIDLGIVNFQPSELAKLALILYISKILYERELLRDELIFVPLPVFFWVFLISFLISLQPNFSTAAILFLISIAMLFVGRIKIKYLLVFSSVILLVGVVYGISETYRLNRIVGFVEFLTSEQQTGLTYQTNQALIAIGNGGILGLGPGKSHQSKLFLPESYGDYIFSIIGEEYGLLGLFGVIFIFSLIIFRIFRIAQHCVDSYAFFITVGIIVSLGIYFIVNAFVNLGFLPSTGLPMPFISYGGSSMMINAVSIGIILNIHRNINSQEYE